MPTLLSHTSSVVPALLIAALAAEAAAQSAPPVPYVAKGACPFECCTYRDWTALQPITLYNRPDGKTVVGALRKGEVVKALTGEIHSIPVRATAEKDHPEAGIKAGEAFYVLHYVGEGVWSVWRNGRAAELETYAGPPPKTTWWVKVRTRAGVVGWAVSNRNFGNQDACA